MDIQEQQDEFKEDSSALNQERSRKILIWACGILFMCLLTLSVIFIGLIISSGSSSSTSYERPEFDLGSVQDRYRPEAPYEIINEECFLDRDRGFHLTCQLVPNAAAFSGEPDMEGVEVGYVLYGYGSDQPYSIFSAFADANGYVDVIVLFDGLANTIDDEHVIGSVEGLRSYDVYMVEGFDLEHSLTEHDGEAEFARNNWIRNDSWYKVDYRSYGSRSQAAFHSGKSPDPEVAGKFHWNTAPQRSHGANPDGSCNYWNGKNWILVHDYSWIGQIWLTMCPGMIYYIDGVEYEAEGVFNIDRNNSINAVYAITGKDPLIIQTCDGWVYVRIIYGYPTEQKKAAEQQPPSELVPDQVSAN